MPRKKLAHDSQKNFELNCAGIRRAEGGIRTVAYKSCFDEQCGTANNFRPIFWFKNEDKKYYEQLFDVRHSACYEKYGLTRTGCVGCPYNRKVTTELSVIQYYEPKLYNACMNIFGKSYEYTQQYREFAAKMEQKEKAEKSGRIKLF